MTIYNEIAVPSQDNCVNYFSTTVWAGQAGLTTVGTNGRSSYYGTYDQGGNVREWTDVSGTDPNYPPIYYEVAIIGGKFNSTDTSFNISKNGRMTNAKPDGKLISNNQPYIGLAVGGRLSTINNPLNLPNFVTVGDAGNANDTNGFGGVSYVYQIGKYEITNNEFCEFLNAVVKTDPYGIVDPYLLRASIQSTNRVGINRSGESGNYIYSVNANQGNKPYNMRVNWFVLARYCNWLHNGKPTGAPDSSTTEDGAYTLNGATTGWFLVNPGANYRIPSEDEWYKAAYYKGNGLNSGYWNYSTQSDDPPSTIRADSTGNGIVPRTTVSGTSTPTATYNITVSGGIGGSGSVTQTFIDFKTASGGIIANGNLNVATRYSITSSGGVVISGTMVLFNDKYRDTFGGIRGGGSANNVTIFNRPASGTILGGGAVFVSKQDTKTTSGGSQLGGSSSFSGIYNISTKAAVVLAGSAVCRVIFNTGRSNQNVVIPQIKKPQNTKPLGITQTNFNSSQSKGLVAWWNNSIPHGNKWYDRIGDNHGLINSPDVDFVWQTDTERGHVLDLNGDYVEINGKDYLANFNEFTISFWVNRVGDGSGYESLLSKDQQFGVLLNSSGSLVVYFFDQYSYPSYVFSSVPTNNTWLHISITKKYNSLFFYRNGLIENQITVDPVIQSSGSALYVGSSDTLYSNATNAKLDDLRIYNRALSSSEVYNLYNPTTRWNLWQSNVNASITYFDEPFTKVFIVCGGRANVATQINVTGGIRGGGSALQTFRDFEIGSGGICGAGSATQTFRDIEIGSGGIVASGSAPNDIVRIGTTYNITASGGIRGAGSALQTFRDFEIGSGGIRGVGTATQTSIYSYNPTLDTSLLLYLKFDESSGTSRTDSSIYNLTATSNYYSNVLVNAPTKFTNSRSFDNGDQVTVSGFDLNKGYKGFTLSFWYKGYDLSGYYNNIFGTNTSFNINFYLDGDDNFYTEGDLTTDSSTTYFYTDASLGFNNWNHFCYTWDSATDSIKVYVNGDEYLSTAASGNFIAGPSNKILYIGDAQGNHYLDDYRVYGRALSANEISRLAGGYNLVNAPLAGSSATSLVRYNVIATGGIRGGSSATQTFNDIENGSGGIRGGGSATPTQSYNIIASGGINGSGSSTIEKITGTVIASGGINGGGLAIYAQAFNYIISGGIRGAGSAAFTIIYDITVFGGGKLSGTIFQPNTVYEIIPDIGDNFANYGLTADWNGSEFGNTTSVGTNGRSSYYGTYDQCGNVREWVDIIYDGSTYASVLRGGRFNQATELELSSDYRDLTVLPDGSIPSTGGNVGQGAGGRVATITNPLGLANFVTIGNAGNDADDTGFGAVSYIYQIGKYEITNDEYCEFLNAIAQADTYALHDDVTGPRVGIARTGTSGNYVYTVNTNFGNKPYSAKVDWFKLARYCNWLHNGKPTGAQNASTTETGAYTLNGALSGYILVNPGATYRIPTENEWYKAAYYKGSGTVAGYWTYATQSETIPNTITANADGDGVLPKVMVAGGTLTSSFTYNVVTAGGAQGGSSARQTFYDFETGSGGIRGGSSGIQIFYDFEVGSGGIRGASSATNTITYNVAVSGGIQGGSSVTIKVVYAAISTGGIIGGSSAIISKRSNLIASGGAQSGGNALVLAKYNISPLGSSKCSGTSNIACSYNSPLLDSSLELYWKFDETSGLTVVDYSIYGRNGTRSNAGGYSSQKPNLKFTNSRALDNNVPILHSSSVNLNNKNSISFSFWLYFNLEEIYPTIVNLDGIYFSIAVNNSSSIGCTVSVKTNQGISYLDVYDVLFFQQWQHVCFTWDSTSQTIRLYVNSTLVGFESALGNYLIANNEVVTDPTYKDYYIDDLRIYSKSLSLNEISRLASGYDLTNNTLLGTSSVYNVAFCPSVSGGGNCGGSFAVSVVAIYNPREFLETFYIIPQVKKPQNTKPLGITQTNFDSPQSKGLIAWWNNSIPHANTWYDRIGDNHGTINSPDIDLVWQTDPVHGHVLDLNGDYVEIGGKDYLADLNEFTISFWVNRNGTGDGTEAIVYRSGQIEVLLQSNGEVNFTLFGSISNISLSGGELSINNWVNYTLVKKSYNFDEEIIIIYKNGIVTSASSWLQTEYQEPLETEDSEYLENNQSSIGFLNNGLGNLYIGSSDSSYNNSVNAKIDDLRIYNRSLTPSEVYNLYNPSTRWDLWQKLTNSNVVYDENFNIYGIVGNGESNIKAYYNLESLGGAELSGNARKLFTFSVIMSGGVSLGGSLPLYALYNISIGGGTECAGSSYINLLNNPNVSGGARISGSAISSVSNNDAAAANGGLNGAGSALQTFNDIENGNGGILGGSSATSAAIYNLTVSGGAKCAGSALQTFNDIEIISGGTRGGSSATPTATYNIIATGGAIGSGSATQTFSDVETGSGGISSGSSATPAATYNIAVAGGILGASSAITSISSYVFVASGGSQGGGSALQTFRDVESGSGGILGSGSITVAVIYNFTASGGIRGSGFVDIVIPYRITVSGGINGGGTSGYNFRYNLSVLGGTQCSGASIANSRNNIHTSGGILIGGSASQAFNDIETMLGGSVSTGSAIINVAYTNSPSKGLIAGGNASIQLYVNDLFTGGILLGGAASYSNAYVLQSTGGAVLSGITPSFKDTFITSGGCSVSGTSLVNCVYDTTASGGGRVSGTTFQPNTVYDIIADVGDNFANYGQVANWNGSDTLPVDNQGNITTVGTNGRSSYYGTYDQCGNVREWVDIVYDGTNYLSPLRGGRMNQFNSDELSSDYRDLSHAPDGTRIDGDIGQGAGGRIATTTNPLGLANFVTIGNAGNDADNTGFGAVSYVYQIGKYEITYDEYCEFLNAVAKTDTYNLLEVTTGPRTGMVRTGTSGNYVYTVSSDFNKKPFNMKVDWFKLARYCNWLHNGKPTGAQNASTTETGAYALNGALSGYILVNPGATYRIPTEDEWYKAAYYKGGGTVAGYWSFATQSETIPNTITADFYGNGILPKVMVAGGTLTSSFTYNVIATGGAQAGSSATISTRISLATSGGIKCNSSSNVLFTYNISPSKGGVVNGTTIVSGTYTIASSGGVVGGASPAINVRYNLNVSGGAVCGGGANILFKYNVSPTKGGVVGGVALQTFFDYEIMDGGARVNGSAIVSQIHNISLDSAGLIAGGSAEIFVYYNLATNGRGGICSGSAIEKIKYRPREFIETSYIIPQVKKPQNTKPLGITQTNFDSAQSKGLIAWWNNSIPHANTWYDRIGDNHGTINSPDIDLVWQIDPIRGHALELYGDYVEIGGKDYLANLNEFTISFWVNRNGIGNGLEALLNKEGQISVFLNNFGFVQISFIQNGLPFELYDNGLTNNSWTLYTITKGLLSGSECIALYKNGTFITSTNISGLIDGGGSLYVGCSDSVYNNSVNAKIDDLRIYNRSLTPSEVYNLYSPSTRWDLWQKNTDATLAYDIIYIIFGVLGDGDAYIAARYNIAPSGGLSVGPNVPIEVQATYNISMLSGASVGGTAQQTFVDYETMAGGIKAGGSRSFSFFYNINASGGIRGGGSAIQTFRDIEIGSGGINGGSSATPVATYNLTVTGGISGGGSAIPTFSDIETGSGGARGGSSATPTVTFSPTVSGGIRGGGSAIQTFRDIEIGSGGINGGSSATPVATYNLAVTGGISGGGSAPQTLNDVESISGGARGGSSATPTVTFSPTVSGGIRGGGSAIQTFRDIEIGSGGINGGSSATPVATYNLTVTGGIRGAGTASDVSLSTNIGSGGISGGSSATPIATYNINVTGGISGGSSATPIATYNINVTGGISGGSSATPISIYTITASGGARSNGSTIQTFSDVENVTGGISGGSSATSVVAYTINISGGIRGSGSATQTFSDIEAGTGGVLCGSSATPATIYNATVSGGIRCAGSAKQTFGDVETGSGGISGGSSATPTATYNLTVFGGIHGSGSATQTLNDVEAGTGGVLGGSSATPTATYNLTVSGGTLSGSFVTPATTYNSTVSGGINSSGSAISEITYNINVSGGVIFAGSAPQTFIDIETGSGGVLAGGLSESYNEDTRNTSGGIKCGGLASDTAVFETIVISGVTISGESMVSVESSRVAFGGLISSGIADIKYVINSESLGGSVISGSALNEVVQNTTVVGGLKSEGDADVQYIANVDSLGGSIVSGVVNVSKNSQAPASGGLSLNGSSNNSTTYSFISNYGLVASGTALEEIIRNLPILGGSKTSGSANVKYTATIKSSGGINCAGVTLQVFSDTEETSGGITASGEGFVQYGRIEIASGGAQVSGVAYFIARKGFWHRSTGKTILIGGTATASKKQKDFKHVAQGKITLDGDNLFTLAYFDMPCDTEIGIDCLYDYPNEYIQCENEKQFFGQCLVYNRPYKCSNSSTANLAAITVCRQKGYLPSKDRSLKMPNRR
jgi:formylglycine-generating enzyme required for sulfatase activity